MKIAILADLHFGVRNNSQFFLDHQKKFFYDFFFPYLMNNHIKNVWILGDVFENRKQLNVQILHEATQFFGTLNSNLIDTVCLLGNHDVYYKNTNVVSSLAPITRSFDRIKLIETFNTINYDGLSVGFVSWISPEIKTEAFEWIKTVDANVLCGHFEINSFEIIKGLVCSKGLDVEMFDRFDKVFSGHFHIRASNGLIQYIGNPYQTNWGEYGYPKGFGVFDTKTKAIDFVNNPVSVYNVFNYSDNLLIKNFNKDDYQSKIVRVIVNEYKNKKNLEAFLDAINSVAYSVELIENKEVVVNDEGMESVPSDTIQLIHQFLDTCKIEHLDKKQLTDVIFEIYSEAIEKGVVEC